MHYTPRNVLLNMALLGLAISGARADKVDDYVEERMKSRKIPGMSVAVVQNGKVVKVKGYGLANVELDVPAKPDTVYQLASITKQFTATAIMMLVEEGKIGLEDPITKYLDGLPSAWSGVTIRQLLNHTSGIKSYTDFITSPVQFRKDVTHSEIIQISSEKPVDFAPGEKWRYNNTGYYLLGMILEKASGKSYEAFLKERIFIPLEMTSTRLNVNQEIIKKRAAGYTMGNSGLRNGEFVSTTQPYAAGALVSTVEDMAKWDAALYTEKLLKKSTLEQMWSPTKLKDGKTQDYGFGWALSKQNGHREVGHGGGIPGFSTYIGRYLDDKLTIIVLANSDFANAQALARGIAQTYLPDLAPQPEKALVDADPKIAERMRKLLRDTMENKLDLTQFTDEARPRIQEGVKGAQQLLKSLGALQKVEIVRKEERDGLQFSHFRLVFERDTLRGLLGIDKEGKIAAIGLSPGE